MKQFLLKLFEISGAIWRVSFQIGQRLVEALRGVDVDAPRTVLLCVALQLIIAVSVIVTFRIQTEAPARAVPGQSEPISVEPDSGN
jgi:hypothetical protein